MALYGHSRREMILTMIEKIPREEKRSSRSRSRRRAAEERSQKLTFSEKKISKIELFPSLFKCFSRLRMCRRPFYRPETSLPREGTREGEVKMLMMIFMHIMMTMIGEGGKEEEVKSGGNILR